MKEPPDRTRSDLRGVEAREAAGREKGNSSVVAVEDATEIEQAHADSLARLATTEDERFVGLVSAFHWTLEARAKAALLKSDDADQALDLIIEGWRSPDPDHRRHVDRVSKAWAREHKKNGHRKTDAETLLDALLSLDDEETWWFRCRLPSGIAELSTAEHRTRQAVSDLWKEVSCG